MYAIETLMKRQRSWFRSGRTLSVPFRMDQLRRLREELHKRLPDLEAAVESDLKRHHFETFAAETLLILAAIKHTLRDTPRWAAAKRVRPSLLNVFSRDRIIPEPYGLSLIISPWNYPLLLALGPLIAAISAGNCVVLKPSEFSPASSTVLGEIITAVFPEDYVTLIQGDAGTATALLAQQFDKIFFTGSARVGKVVLEAAARHMTPVTLELGGKSPCIVTESADASLAAGRIIWGKLLNAGQTCIAPDYILAHRTAREALVTQLIARITSFYGSDIERNPEYPRIVNQTSHARLVSYLDPDKIVWGGEHNQADLYFGPTIMTDVTWDDPVMREEIFGPILPIITYDTLEEAVERINDREKPLALYLFTDNHKQIDTVWTRCHFGGGCVNDTMSQFINDRLPFGGVGLSGMGSYHGRWGFEAFSHYKSLVHRAAYPDIPARYPPYVNKGGLKRFLVRLFTR